MDNRATAEVLQDIVADVQEMVRSEVRLAMAELTERAKQFAGAGGMLGTGAALCLFAGVLIVVAGVAALALVMPVWLACLSMAVFLAMIGGGLALVGRQRLRKTSLKPERTIHAVRNDVAWLKQQIR